MVACIMLMSTVIVLMPATTPLPQWSAPQPDGTKPLAGFNQLASVSTHQLVHGNEDIGGAVDSFVSRFLEDTAGILVTAQSSLTFYADVCVHYF